MFTLTWGFHGKANVIWAPQYEYIPPFKVLVERKIDRRPSNVTGKFMLCCRFSHQPSHWSLNNSWLNIESLESLIEGEKPHENPGAPRERSQIKNHNQHRLTRHNPLVFFLRCYGIDGPFMYRWFAYKQMVVLVLNCQKGFSTGWIIAKH